MVKKFGYFAIAVIFIFTSSGCATVFHGTSTAVRINSVPPGATAMVGGKTVITPSTVSLKNNQTYQIVFTKDGYEDAYYLIDKYMSGWIWSNLCLYIAYPIGMWIDGKTGGLYKLVPTEANVTLIPKKVNEK